MKKILFYAIPILLGGCVPILSVNPFFTDLDVVFEEKLLGAWVDDINDPDMTWMFSRNEEDPNNAYQLSIINREGDKGSFNAVLMKLGSNLFLDIYPNKEPWDEEDPNNIKFIFNAFFLIPTHSIIKVDSIGQQLLLKLTQDEEFEEFIKDYPDAIQYADNENVKVLTASTKELQAFIKKYSDDDRLFPDENKLVRKEE
ncbi:MAG: hypothetical protein JXA96_03110 [Sedimentisphaerales bacterium]|nr:hypothetical protein [Sedimentisphaerales bacterium]